MNKTKSNACLFVYAKYISYLFIIQVNDKLHTLFVINNEDFYLYTFIKTFIYLHKFPNFVYLKDDFIVAYIMMYMESMLDYISTSYYASRNIFKREQVNVAQQVPNRGELGLINDAKRY